MIKIISFDFDGTLVKRSYADKVWLEGLPKLYAKEKKIPLKQAKEYILKEYDKIGKDRKEWYDIDWWFKFFELKENWQNLLNNYRHTIKLFPETVETLSNLSKKYELIITSNSKREFIDVQLEETNIRPYFTHIFSSTSDFDKVKKLPEIYKEICSLLNVQPSEMLHVGDDKEFDFESPKKIGIKSFYLDREKTEKGNHIIRKLSELDTILNKK
jgi:HAD superfamily hydrolase (TIGR01549 family)